MSAVTGARSAFAAFITVSSFALGACGSSTSESPANSQSSTSSGPATSSTSTGGTSQQSTTASSSATSSSSVPSSNPSTSTTTPTASGETVVDINVTGGQVTGGAKYVDIELGKSLTIRVTGDTADDVHVHGYDIKQALTPGRRAEITFTADIPGVYEVELEESGLVLVHLQIS